jgi:hypothetical protein
MANKEKIFRSVKLAGALPPETDQEYDPANDDVMRNPDYLRQSSSLINDALQKGFDVLQLANGDIVTTGTKIVVTQYSWDEEKGKLVKAKSGSSARRGRPRKSEAESSDANNETLEDA